MHLMKETYLNYYVPRCYTCLNMIPCSFQAGAGESHSLKVQTNYNFPLIIIGLNSVLKASAYLSVLKS